MPLSYLTASCVSARWQHISAAVAAEMRSLPCRSPARRFALRSIRLPHPFLHPPPPPHLSSSVLSSNPSSRLTDLWPRPTALLSCRRHHYRLALLLPQVHLHSGQLCAPPGPALNVVCSVNSLTLQPPSSPTQDFLAAFPFLSAVFSRRPPGKVSR